MGTCCKMKIIVWNDNSQKFKWTIVNLLLYYIYYIIIVNLGWEDPLEKEMTTHSSILAWRIPWTEETGSYSPWDHKESDTIKWVKLSLS